MTHMLSINVGKNNQVKLAYEFAWSHAITRLPDSWHPWGMRCCHPPTHRAPPLCFQSFSLWQGLAVLNPNWEHIHVYDPLLKLPSVHEQQNLFQFLTFGISFVQLTFGCARANDSEQHELKFWNRSDDKQKPTDKYAWGTNMLGVFFIVPLERICLSASFVILGQALISSGKMSMGYGKEKETCVGERFQNKTLLFQ